MKLVKYASPRGQSFGLVVAGKVVDIPAAIPECASLGDVLQAANSPKLSSLRKDSASGVALSEITLLPPVADGARIFGIGLNYKAHVNETGNDMPPEPVLFIRTNESLVGHGADIVRPKASANFDYEGELAVVIGKGGRHIPADMALTHIAGYTCFNDGSVRDFQKHSVTAGKNFDSSGACGPWIVTADEIADPTKLILATRLNGTEVQRSGTDMLIYSIPRCISYISLFTELRTGDIIATGTPAGVGARRAPPLWMKAGDTIEVEISGIGVLKNQVASEK